MVAEKRVKKLAPTPRMRRGTYTADQVLAWTERRIAEEPKRLDMGEWIKVFRGKDVLFNLFSVRPADLPACGTVACEAGWINIGTRNYDANRENFGSRAALTKLGLIKHGDPTPAGDALAGLFLNTRLTPEEVIAEVQRIRKEYKRELTRSKVVVE